jgi:hypothetical protein
MTFVLGKKPGTSSTFSLPFSLNDHLFAAVFQTLEPVGWMMRTGSVETSPRSFAISWGFSDRYLTCS